MVEACLDFFSSSWTNVKIDGGLLKNLKIVCIFFVWNQMNRIKKIICTIPSYTMETDYGDIRPLHKNAIPMTLP